MTTATTGHDGTDGQRTDDDGPDDGTDDGTDGRTEDDDGDDGADTMGRTDEIYIYIYIYIFPKFHIQHWVQDSNVKVNRPYNHLSG